MSAAFRIGIDLGGSKIAAAALDSGGRIGAKRRIATPSGDCCGTAGPLWPP